MIVSRRYFLFRPQRFAGDFADYGTEIQISDFAKGSSSWHVPNQARLLPAARLQPHATQAAAPRHPGCSPTHSGRSPM